MSLPTRIVLLVTFVALGTWWAFTEHSTVHASGPRGWRKLEIGGADGSLAGQLLVDPEVDLGLLDIGLRCYHGGEEVMRLVPEVAEDGSFFLGSLPPCRAKLEIGIRQAPEALLSIQDLVIPLDAPCPDTRLASIDLRGRVHVFRFDVLDFEGEAASEVALGWRPTAPEDDARPYARWIVGSGPLAIVSETDLVDLLVLGRGARPLELFGVGHGRTLNLREGWPVRIALPDDVADVAHESEHVQSSVRLHRIQLDPRIDREDSRGGRFHAATLEARLRDGEAEVVVPQPGSYEVEWRVDVREPDGAWRRLSLGRTRPVVEVDESSYDRVLRPHFPTDEYRAAVSRR